MNTKLNSIAVVVVVAMLSGFSTNALAVTVSQNHSQMNAAATLVGGVNFDQSLGGEIPGVGGVWVRVIAGLGTTIAEVNANGTVRLTYNDYPGTGPLMFSGSSGTASMNFGFQFNAKYRVKVSILGIDLEGDFPFVPQYDFRLFDSKNFTPYLLGSSVTLSDEIVNETLIDQPVVGIPGISLNVKVDLSMNANNRISGQRIITGDGNITTEGGTLPVSVNGSSKQVNNVKGVWNSDLSLTITPSGSLKLVFLIYSYDIPIVRIPFDVPVGAFDFESQPQSVTLNYPTATLTVSAGNGGTASGGGTYYVEETRQISASANNCYSFVRWSDGDRSNPRFVKVPSGGASFTAEFEISRYTISCSGSPSSGGSVSGCGTFDCGANACLTATPANSCWRFVSWTDGNTQNPRCFTVTASASFTATFEKFRYTINCSASPSEGGSVSGCGAFDCGAGASLQPNANPGYHFTRWSDGNEANPLNITVSQNASYTAEFVPDPCVFTISPPSATPPAVGGSGTITISKTSGPGTCQWTSSSTAGWLTFNPSSGAGGQTTWSATANPDAARTANATVAGQSFSVSQAAARHTITCAASPTAGGSVSGCGQFDHGQPASLTATANVGYRFSQWNDGNTQNPRAITVTQPATFTATFIVDDPCAYTISPPSATAPANGSSGAITISKTSGPGTCQWTASSTDGWLTFNPSSGAGGQTTWSATANPGAARTANATVAGQSFSVSQDPGTCVYSVSPTSVPLPCAGGSANVTVSITSGSGCNWQATESCDWLTVSPAAGTVTLTAIANGTQSSRSCNVVVAGQSVTVSQVGGCVSTRILGLSGNLAFGSVLVGTNATRTLTISNTGSSALMVSSIGYPSGFSGNWGNGAIAAGGSQNVTVTFAPSDAQSYNGTITVNSDKTSGNNTISCSGTCSGCGGVWAGATDLGGGWKWLGWFGYFAPGANGWIYHQQHGWMYTVGTTSANIWFWTSDMGWLWTGSSVYPSLYRLTGSAWLWYLRDSSNPRWFYNLSTGGWESR